MREALIVWGGWSGHEPEQCADIIAGMLRKSGFKVYLENFHRGFCRSGAQGPQPHRADHDDVEDRKRGIGQPECRGTWRGWPGGPAWRHGRRLPQLTGIPIYLRRPVGRPSRQRHRLPGGYYTAGRSGDAGPVQLRVSLGTILYARGSVERSAGDHHLLRGTCTLDRRRGNAGRMEATPRQRTGVLFVTRACGRGIPGPGNEDHSASWDAVGSGVTLPSASS